MASRRSGTYIPISSNQPGYSGNYAQNYAQGQHSRSRRFYSIWLDTAHHCANSIDHKVSYLGAPLKPYLPLISRFLVVCTFLEDSFRITTNWSQQVKAIWQTKGIPWVLVQLFFVFNVAAMLSGSFLVLSKKKLEFGVGFLIASMVTQSLVYGMFNWPFLMRNVSLCGGLLLVLSDVFVHERRRLPGLPEVNVRDHSQNIILAGRVSIVVLFISHLLSTKWSLGTAVINVLSVSACTLLVVGYKARMSASVLAFLLLVQNFTTNAYWSMNYWSPSRDFKRYEFFQILSIVGGLILLVNIGAGKLSIDEKRKIY